MTIARECRPCSVLDVGIGFGQYGYMLRQAFDDLHQSDSWTLRLEGIEAFEPYITPIQRYVYDFIHVGDARAILPSMVVDSVDLALLLDVIEHLTHEDGVAVLERLRSIATSVIVTTPAFTLPQGAVYGNEHERHLSFWPGKQFRGACTMRVDRQTVAFFTRDARLKDSVGRWMRRQRVKRWTPPTLLAAFGRSQL